MEDSILIKQFLMNEKNKPSVHEELEANDSHVFLSFSVHAPFITNICGALSITVPLTRMKVLEFREGQ